MKTTTINNMRWTRTIGVAKLFTACSLLAGVWHTSAQSYTPAGPATLNGTTENSITLTAGANLTGSFPYLAFDGPHAGANMVVVVGLVNSANQWVGGSPQVVYNGVPSQSGTSGTANWSNLVVPQGAGTYQLWFQGYMTANANGSVNQFEGSPPTVQGTLAGVVATVTVGAPPTFTPTGMATLNGTAENSITLTPGASLTGSFPYLASDGGSAGANMVVVVGLVNSANQWVGGSPQVVYNGVPSQSGTSGTANWSNLVVPQGAGTYQLWFQGYMTANANGSVNQFEGSPPTVQGTLAGVVATVTVGAPPTFTPTGMATLNGTAENSITLTPGASLTGSFPYLASDGGSAGANMVVAVGLVNGANQWVGGSPQVVYNGVPSQSGTSGTANWSNLVVPQGAGTYQLWFQGYMTANANGSINQFEGSPPTVQGTLAGVVATVTVGAPPTFTPTGIATLNGTAENSITLTPGASLTGSFPYLASDGGSAGANMVVAVGLVNGANQWVGGSPQVVYNGVPLQSGTSGTANWSNLVVPQGAGTYQLWFQGYMTANANGSINQFEGSPPAVQGTLAGVVAAVTVGAPPTFTPTGMATLNGTAENSITLTPGASLTGSFPYLASDGGSAGANMVVAVGLVNGANQWVGGSPQVVYNGVPLQSGTSGTANWSNLVVPQGAGTYQLWFQGYMTANANGSINQFEGSPPTVQGTLAGVVAAVTVGAPPTFTPTGMATLNGTAENSITLTPGASLTGSFPYLASDGGSAGANMVVAVGLVNGANQWVGGSPQVVYNGVPLQSGTSGTANWSNLVVPQGAGTYQLWFQGYMTANANGSINQFEGSPPTVQGTLAGVVAAVTVGAPPTFTPTGMATLNGTAENSITLTPGASLTGSFPYLASDGGSAGANMVVAVGLVNGANQWVGGSPQVVYNGVPLQSGTSGTANWSNLVVPQGAGTYQLWFQGYMTANANGSINQFEGSPPTVQGTLAGVVATVTARFPFV